MSTPEPDRPLYLRGGGPPVFAFLHMGAAGLRDTAVILCPPFGWEDMCSYRIRREWAEHLARGGHTTLRVDLPGSGDSAGSPADPARLEAWTRAVAEAAHRLRRDGNAGRVAVIGLGLGGLVACRAALQSAPIDELVLWSVPARGRSILRELRTFAALEVANRPEAGEPAPVGEAGEDGTVVANGYLLSAETVRELEHLDLGEPPPSAPATRRALLLGRDGLKVDKALPGALVAAGIAATVADGPGYGAMIVEPQDARPPLEVFELVSSWLQEGEGRGGAPAATGEGRAATAPAAADGSIDREQASDHEEIVLDHLGVALRETPVFFEGPGGRLFGVLCEPLQDRAELTGVLLNAGPQRRTGPNRMWVEIARRWAAGGVPTLRLDAAGIGDSDGDASVLGRVTEFYKPLYVEQSRAAIEMLVKRGLPPRFVMLGLCAGAYWSAQTALADERVASVLMLNPRTLVFDEWRHTLRRTRRLGEQALLPSTWRKVFRGEIMLAKHLETGRTVLGRAARAPMRASGRLRSPGRAETPGGESAGRHPVEDLFDRLRDRGQRGLLLFTGKEVLRRELDESGVLDRMDRWPNLELVLTGTSADTHTLTPLWLQREVHGVVDRFLQQELGRLTD